MVRKGLRSEAIQAGLDNLFGNTIDEALGTAEWVVRALPLAEIAAYFVA